VGHCCGFTNIVAFLFHNAMLSETHKTMYIYDQQLLTLFHIR